MEERCGVEIVVEQLQGQMWSAWRGVEGYPASHSEGGHTSRTVNSGSGHKVRMQRQWCFECSRGSGPSVQAGLQAGLQPLTGPMCLRCQVVVPHSSWKGSQWIHNIAANSAHKKRLRPAAPPCWGWKSTKFVMSLWSQQRHWQRALPAV